MTIELYTVRVTGLLLAFFTSINSQPNCVVYQLNATDTKECCSSMEKQYAMPPIYCYPGNEKHALNVFQTVTVMVDLLNEKTNDFIVYQAVDKYAIEEQMVSDVSTFSFNKILSYLWKQKDFKLNPFEPSCFSVKTNANFKIKIQSIAFDNRRLAMFTVGLFMFGYSARLSCNTLFHYLCSITVGMTTLLVIIIILISRLIPKKNLMIGYLGASCLLSIYAVQMMIKNINVLLILYYKYLLGYMLLSMLVSCVVCYRYGPVTKTRSIDLIRWTLQLLGLALVTLCSFHVEAMVFVDILSILFYYTKCSQLFGFLPKHKPKLRLLSEEEYKKKSMIEKSKILKKLEKYRESPDCDTGNVVSQLRNPITFSEFMETSTHTCTETVEEEDEEKFEDFENEFKQKTNNKDSNSSDDFKEMEYISDNE